jgi:hypothetical protein
LARRIPLPAFLSARRPRTVAAAAAAALAAGLTAAALALPASVTSAPAGATGVAAARMAADGNSQVLAGRSPGAVAHARYGLGQQEAAAAKAAAAAGVSAATAVRPVAAQHTRQARQDAKTVPSGSPREIAKAMLSTFGWQANQFSCLQPLWYHESGWNQAAENPSSGAYGIPQALPGAQMAAAGADWQTNPATQIRWGLTYIHGRYGSPCGAWAHEQSHNWY